MIQNHIDPSDGGCVWFWYLHSTCQDGIGDRQCSRKAEVGIAVYNLTKQRIVGQEEDLSRGGHLCLQFNKVENSRTRRGFKQRWASLFTIKQSREQQNKKMILAEVGIAVYNLTKQRIVEQEENLSRGGHRYFRPNRVENSRRRRYYQRWASLL